MIKETLTIEELSESYPEAYTAFIRKLEEECFDSFVVLDNGRIVNADRPDGTVIAFDGSEWTEASDDDEEADLR